MIATIHGGAASPQLTDAEAAAIEARVKTLEARTGTQVVAALVERSLMSYARPGRQSTPFCSALVTAAGRGY